MKYTDGTYTSKAQGHSSDVNVSVVIAGNKITDVQIDVGGETSSRNAAVVSQLRQEVLDNQTADIDAVSGASETSSAVRRAVNDCINQASGKAEGEKTPVKDGVYEEVVPSYNLHKPMTGQVEFADGKIKSIKITDEGDSQTSPWFGVVESKFIPRLLKNQSLDTDVVTGASVSSGAIKSIAEKAINDAGGNADEWHTPVAKKHDVVEKKGYDVIVVGLGGSGILSYCSAADNGAKVFGIEGSGEIGGNSVLTSGPMVVNSKNLSAKYNDGKDNIDRDDLLKTWMEYVKTDVKKDVIEEAIDQDGPALDYYMDKFDFNFDGAGLGGPAGFLPSFVRPDWKKEWIIYGSNSGKWYTISEAVHIDQYQNALDKAKAMNPANDYQLELRAQKFLTDENGKVIGVSAKSYDGTTYNIYGKTVILASGGFIGNKEMMKEVYGHTAHVFGSLTATGTGIQMGRSVGGNTYALGTLPMIHITQVPNIIRDDSLTPEQKATLSALAITSDAKQLDETGKLLGSKDESGTKDAEITVGVAYAPGFHYFDAYTQEDLDKIQKEGLSETTSKVMIILLDQGKVPEAGVPIKGMPKIIDEGIKHGDVWKGTPKELAEQLGMDEAVLTKSLGDPDKTYYIFEACGYAYATCGGLDVDKNMNVLRKDGTPIENVFAVGQDSEGVENRDGEAYTPWGGQAQAWTFTSGKIAGEHAAKVSRE
ncbi:fumarate reductase flavoprotein subunit [Lactobacillus nasalidis]|uniref:Urocanate reductase n=1 Tax=Lactobacillus nasalidis TaxID=2797258 RepID=A0ABQ3W3Y7_9LACO|nr:FAD-binding protein [Lactobacillus nasalidis]GHV97311.1 fumarate reductase flavoprotein subunit [Lactobacillus nasalidis]GHV99907.1 fumarate reductase flavoprotein subunit [Lactobacillus nasalidis]GHW01190.1 fumarate reductase flavoprotein subunit [Lactobacillus nasalidis]